MSKRKFEQIDQGSIVVYHENRLIFFIQGNKNVKIIQTCM